MNKFLKEALWVLFTCLASIPLSFLFLHYLNQLNKSNSGNKIDEIFIFELFLFGFFINFVGIYLSRVIITILKRLSIKKQ